MIVRVPYYCTKCGREKDRSALQPSTDARDRWRMGICECSPGDHKGHRPLVTFALTEPSTKAKWRHADGNTRWCKECKSVGLECINPRPAAGEVDCVCSHALVKM